MNKTYKKYLEMVKNDGWNLKKVPKNIQTNEMIDTAMDNDPWAFIHIKDKSNKTFERCLKVVKHDRNALYDIPKKMLKKVKKAIRKPMTKERERELMFEIERNVWSFNGIKKSEQTDTIIDFAMGLNALIFKKIKDKNKRTSDRYLKSVKHNGLNLKAIPKKMQTDEIIKVAINKCSYAFRWIRDENKKTLELCIQAVKDNEELFEYVPDKLKEKVKKELGL